MKTLIRATFLTIAFCLCAAVSFAQENTPEAEEGKELKIDRVTREHNKPTKKEFAFLSRKLIREGDTITREQAEKDLDQLEWLLENRFSYLELRGVDYKAALDSIRMALEEKNYIKQFALEIRKLIALFGDGHSRVRPLSQIIPKGYLAFFPIETGGKVYAVNDERRRLVVNSYPYIKSIDSLPISKWLKAAELVSARGNEGFVRYQRQGIVPGIKYLRRELGVKSNRWIKLELTNDKGKSLELKTPLMPGSSKGKSWPRREHELLKGNIGYLRIPAMTSDQEFLHQLKVKMSEFSRTNGLIIDLRNNGGGSRDALRVLMPYFLDEKSSPRVVNVAAYRLNVGDKPDFADGYLSNRGLYPQSWPGWSESQRKAISEVAAEFKPDWKLPEGKFSNWHYMVISRSSEPEYYHYKKPVIILQNAGCFSATDIFLGAFKGLSGVTLLGETSGGGSGRSQRYFLTFSKLEVRLSSMASFCPNGDRYDGKGISPGVEHESVISDYIGKSDTMLDRAVKMLKKKGQE